MHFQNKLNLSPKISDDLFLVIDLFHILISYFSVVGAKSVADIDTGGGPKSLHFDKFAMLSLLFLPPREAKLHSQLRWGAMVGFPPPRDPPLTLTPTRTTVTTRLEETYALTTK